MTADSTPRRGAWKRTRWTDAVDAHRAAGHAGDTGTCQDPACQDRVAEAIARACEELPAPPGWRPGGLFPA